MSQQPGAERDERGPDARAHEGFDHLQAAATELIAAARAFLDVADELVREPGALAAVVRAATAVTRPAPRAPGRDDDGAPSGGVERIPLSDP